MVKIPILLLMETSMPLIPMNRNWKTDSTAGSAAFRNCPRSGSPHKMTTKIFRFRRQRSSSRIKSRHPDQSGGRFHRYLWTFLGNFGHPRLARTGINLAPKSPLPPARSRKRSVPRVDFEETNEPAFSFKRFVPCEYACCVTREIVRKTPAH